MSTTTTIHFEVGGDNYNELKANAEAAIQKFIQDSEEDEDTEYEFGEMYEGEIKKPKVNYELIVRQTKDISSDFEYTAEVIARLKDVH